MKRSTPLQRRTPLLRRPLQQVAAEVRHDQATAGTSKQRRTARRRNDAPWAREVLAVRGPQCRVAGCGRMHDIQVDHLIPRAHGGPSILPNGLPLCREHHEMKTNHELLISPEWLDPDQLIWLQDEGHAEWLCDGICVGRRRRLFADGHHRSF